MSDVSPIMKWLDELARYFENRDTGGEDRAHWANVYNSENALKVKAALTASEAEVERMRDHSNRLIAMMPLFEEARDALPAISEASRRLHNISPTLAERMDDVGDPERWRARAALTGETGEKP